MAKEIYLYSPIYNFTAQDIIEQMEENSNEDIVMRMNTPGGDVFAGWGIAAKMGERKGKSTIKVDGAAMSMGAFLLAFADNVEALDVSTIMLHRADMNVEDEKDQIFLDNVNKSLRAKLESKIDDKKLKDITEARGQKVGIKNLFEDEKRVDLYLSAKEAKDIGLVDKINKVNPKEIKAFNEKMFAVAAIHNPKAEQTQIIKTMDITKLKAEHPAIFAEVLELGAKAERERVESCLVFNDIDPVAVKAAIESGKPLSQKQMSEFTLKAISKNALEAIKKDSAGATTTEEVEEKELTAKEKTIKEFEVAARKKLGLKN